MDARRSTALVVEGEMDRRGRAIAIRECLLELPLNQREVFVLYELEELGGAAIASIVGISVNTVWSRLRLARKRFRSVWMRRQGS